MAYTDTDEDVKKKQPDMTMPTLIMPGAPLSPTMPALASPTRMNIPAGQAPNTLPVLTAHQQDLPSAQRNAISRESYATGMPKLTAARFSPDYYQQREAVNAYEKANPWGSVMSSHPGIMGRIGHFAGEIGQAAGNALTPGIMERIPGSQLNRAAQTVGNEAGFNKAETEDTAQQEARGRQAEADTERERAGQQDWHPIDGTDSEIEARSGQTRPMQGVSSTKPETLGDEEGRAVEDLLGTVNPQTGKNYTRAEAIREVSGDKRPAGTNPFEAFAYGTPQERQAAQDFLTFEKRIGAEFRNPSELEERYSLYQRDPDTYKAMFGDRGEAQDQASNARTQAQAARMLKYLDGRRKEIQNDFMLDDTEKRQKLSEIDQLEKPYQDAAQGKAGGEDEGETVQVINPNGTLGTIPVANLKKALKQHYKLAPNQ